MRSLFPFSAQGAAKTFMRVSGTPGAVRTREEQWLWGWDDTPGIVSVWADLKGEAWIWRRTPALVCELARFRPWMLLSTLEDLAHLGARLRSHAEPALPGCVTYRELEGQGLRYLVSAEDGTVLTRAVLRGAARRLGRAIDHVRELGPTYALWLAP
ncbi:MAG TPA: hypothetical protein VI299_18225, partial [Polyangiales bacterium]